MRELTIHSNFVKFFHNYHQKNPHSEILSTPIFALFTETFTTDKTIFTYEYKFLRIPKRDSIRPVNIKILNMVHSSQVEYNDFKSLSPFGSNGDNELFNDLSSQLRDKFGAVLNQSPPPHITSLEAFYSVTLDKLQSLAKEVQSSNEVVRKLEAELKKKLEN
eukprot:TRINITY_DN4127_c0_g2_i1.p1 TRINITY_DN4127_c0_g2~~TRINITY_DN4127_c0_g2_i1.p1  ORF type:complete len:162 (+),score=20.78 TRINITY_DN4127_c0_g2_i1:444-929(+)